MEQYPWHHKLKRQREIRGWSRAYVAESLNIDIKTISRWERGEAFPQSRHRQNLVDLFETNAVDLGLVEDEDSTFLSQALGSRSVTQDWGEAPHIDACYGRQQEGETLQHWILDEECSLIAVLGIGGIGKTTFTTRLARQISNEFAYVIWRSLQNAPPVEQIIASCLQFAPGSAPTNQGHQPRDLDQQFILLRSFLREYRCLIILDNVESIFEAGQRAGHYANEHDSYGRFFQLLGEAEHQSCLLLTSREKPKELIRMEGKTSRVRTFPLTGIREDAGQQLLKDRELSGSPSDWTELVHTYSGNPLALKLVAEPIQELFDGDIASFLAGEEIVLSDIHDLIAQQFQRLTPPEKQVLYSLAVEGGPTSRLDLLEHMRPAYPKSIGLLDALDSLRRRSLIEVSERESEDKFSPYMTLQPVIREYVMTHFVEPVGQVTESTELTPSQEMELSLQTGVVKTGSEEQKEELSSDNSQIPDSLEISLLKEERLNRGWTQVDLASRIGISDRTYRAWENGDVYPSDLSLKRLTKIFGKGPAQLGLEKRPKVALTYATLSQALQELVERNTDWANTGGHTEAEKTQMVDTIRQLLLEIEAGRIEKVAQHFDQMMLPQDDQSHLESSV